MTPKFSRFLIGLAFCLSIRPCAAQSTTPLAAFPGAVGFGAGATGGRGGSVYHVTSVHDSGPGTFRDAVSHGHRIVVFDTGGDGIPDAWALRHKLDPNNPADANGDFDNSGYTNIEKYLNSLADGTAWN